MVKRRLGLFCSRRRFFKYLQSTYKIMSRKRRIGLIVVLTLLTCFVGFGLYSYRMVKLSVKAGEKYIYATKGEAETSLKKNPADVMALRTMAIEAYLVNQDAEANQWIERALRIKPGDRYSRMLYARHLYGTPREAEGRRTLEELAKGDDSVADDAALSMDVFTRGKKRREERARQQPSSFFAPHFTSIVVRIV